MASQSNWSIRGTHVLLAVSCVLTHHSAGAADRPNVLVIVSDDHGYADIGVYGCTDIPTPHIDSLALSGARCTNGYVSAPQCSPTRAGLLTGRYQQRFGHEHNSAHANSALPLSEVTLADHLNRAGYATALVGKWHLGTTEPHHPLKRGFDEFFGFLGGSNPYLPQGPSGSVPRIIRGDDVVQEQEYLTDAFGREAVAFIDHHRDEPFFLYLAFNAPHGPLQATEKYLERFQAIENEQRRTYAAMVSAMDDAIGNVLEKLRELKLDENTLIFFFSDNGGPTDVNGSSNEPFRGVKGEVREGGIRVPFLVQWKAQIAAGTVYEQPVIQLDILPTVLAATETRMAEERPLDGVNLLPYLTGKQQGPPHERLYWRFNFPGNQPTRYKWAIREGNAKLFTDLDNNRKQGDRQSTERSLILVDLEHDTREVEDLSERKPEQRKALLDAWQQWNAELP